MITQEFRGGQNAKKPTKSGLPMALQARRVFLIINDIFKYVLNITTNHKITLVDFFFETVKMNIKI